MVSGFVVSPRTTVIRPPTNSALTCRSSRPRCARAVTRMLNTSAIADRSYQLEELEDEASATSALYLRRDGSIAYGRTDGPEPVTVRGVWAYDENENELRMEIERNFVDNNLTFSVRRVFRGHLDCKKELDMASFAGNIYRDEHDLGDPKSALGYWSMIVATDDLPAEDYDATQVL